MDVTCLGATRTVTGSCFLCRHEGFSFLVDCGMFQGRRELEQRNRKPFPFDPRKIDAVLLTHAHVDHSGLLPRLVAEGFNGTIYATPATVDLCGIILPDSAHIQEMEAEWQTRKNLRKGRKPVEPLYTKEDAERTLLRFKGIPYESPVRLAPGLKVTFRNAGHILGAAFLEIDFARSGEGKRVVFSGDLGHKGQYIIKDPTPLEAADFVFMESTYGNRLHRSMEETLEELARVVREAALKKGKIIMPAFAVERTQELLYALHKLQADGRAPGLPVYVDSPLATSATRIFRRHRECFDQETLGLLAEGENPLDTPLLTFTRSVEESMGLNDLPGPLIIISASGMCNAGRIKHHLKHNLWRAENHVVIVGFQAQGTTGRRLVDGARKVKIFQEDVMVRAAIHTLGGFSGHADRDGLTEWIGGVKAPPEQVFLIHGEEESSLALAERLSRRHALPVEVPRLGERIRLGERAVRAAVPAPAPAGPEVGRLAVGLADRLRSLPERLAPGQIEGREDLWAALREKMEEVARIMDALEGGGANP